MNIFLRIGVLGLLAAAGSMIQWSLMGFPQLGTALDEWGIQISDLASMGEVIWVDARPEGAFALEHYPEAIHLDFDNWDTGVGQILEKWEPGVRIVVYCGGNGCESSRAVANQLRSEFEMEFVYWLSDGWSALKKEGLSK